jgi:tetratricopeptide (TPR) repeat protein
MSGAVVDTWEAMLAAVLALQCVSPTGAVAACTCAEEVPRHRGVEYAAAIERAREHHRAFAVEAAIDAYRRAALLDPGGFEALQGLAEAWNDLGEATTGEVAEDAFARALGYAQCLEELFPTRPQGPYLRAVALGNLTGLRDPGEKVALAREIAAAARCALEREPDFAPALVALGVYERELAGLGFFARAAVRVVYGGVEDTSLEESERLLRRAVAIAPASLPARHELALTLLAAHKVEEASAELRRVLDLLPSSASDVRRQLDAAARLVPRRP